MKDKFIPYEDETRVGGVREGFVAVIRTPYRSLFDEELNHPSPYEAFTQREGISLKMERRTEIRVFNTGNREMFFKHYLYFGVSQAKTLLSRMPKAQREYLTLGYLRSLGIPAVEAIGWGSHWGHLGSVQRCFILTAKEEDTLDFRAWLRKTESKAGFRDRTIVILKKVGEYFKRMHEQGFFLLRPNTRNVLIRHPDDTNPEILFLDQPYARFLAGLGARWGQLQDLSTFLGGTLRHLDEGILDDFFEVYLPDPLGGSPVSLRRRLDFALQARESEGRVGKLALQFRALMPAFLDKS